MIEPKRNKKKNNNTCECQQYKSFVKSSAVVRNALCHPITEKWIELFLSSSSSFECEPNENCCGKCQRNCRIDTFDVEKKTVLASNASKIRSMKRIARFFVCLRPKNFTLRLGVHIPAEFVFKCSQIFAFQAFGGPSGWESTNNNRKFIEPESETMTNIYGLWSSHLNVASAVRFESTAVLQTMKHFPKH